jgi:hypothetical protein
MTDPSPPTKGKGALPGADPRNENDDAQQLADSSPVVNRKLIKSECVFELVEVMERRRRFHYEITDGTRTWRFPLLWSALLKFDRLVAKAGGAQQR